MYRHISHLLYSQWFGRLSSSTMFFRSEAADERRFGSLKSLSLSWLYSVRQGLFDLH